MTHDELIERLQAEPHSVSIEAMEALLDLDARNALAPHGLGGHGRACLASAVQQIKNLQTLLQIKARFANLKEGPLSDPSIESLVAKFQTIANDYDCAVRLTGDERDRIVVALLSSPVDPLSAAEAAQSTRAYTDPDPSCFLCRGEGEYIAYGQTPARMVPCGCRRRRPVADVMGATIRRNARADALEEAAKIADGVGTDLRHGDTRLWHIGAGAAADKIASAIRALGKETGQ